HPAFTLRYWNSAYQT
ncbi:hypothetical protein D046_0606B, partial [Vibrio parahaemolyticus V-223/04]